MLEEKRVRQKQKKIEKSGKLSINRDLVLSNRKSGELKHRQKGYFSLFLC